MKYSIIIPYRDRESHLRLILPRLCSLFNEAESEIIVAEQSDDKLFNIAGLYNVAYKYCTGDILLLHQVDYYPTDDVSYAIADQPVLPGRIGIFVDEQFNRRELTDVPAGYRNWHNEIDPAFYGGVIILKREHWEAIRGLNSMYEGWGNEDEDLRERLKWAGYKPHRNEVGTFLCLHHSDNGAMEQLSKEKQAAFARGRQLLNQAERYKHIGYENTVAHVTEYKFNMPNDRECTWLKISNISTDL